MNPDKSDIRHTLSALKISIYDGIFAQGFAVLTGSIFLPAFALVLGANAFEIGLLAAIPFFATVSQIFGAWLVEKYQEQKQLVLFSSVTARSLWLPLIFGSIWMTGDRPGLFLKIFIGGVIFYHLFASISGVSWLSWMASLVPEEIRGRYFGLRNSILGLLTLVVTLGGGYYLDWFQRRFLHLPPTRAFEILFLVAVFCAVLSSLFLIRQPGIPGETLWPGNWRERFWLPLRNQEFKRFLKFGVIWSFAVNCASPFFIVYMLADLNMSYTLVGLLAVLSALADLLGMWAWGHFSDHIGNRPVIILTAGIATLLPFLWIFTNTGPFSILVLIPVLHLAGGFAWAGYNLCAVNLVFGNASRERNSVYFALWNAANGVFAGLGALAGGLFSHNIDALIPQITVLFDSKYKLIFLLSAGLRLFSLLVVRQIREPRGLPVVKAIRILRSVRSWSSMMGFHPALQFFLPAHTPATKNSAYWPIWKRSRKAARAEGKESSPPG